ncbi:MAG TPA: hypothetical protein PK970_05270 [Hyphomicrobiaceae bacterium]|nr:hypothetical protein [Hyphomicrobiaceae bacterium]
MSVIERVSEEVRFAFPKRVVLPGAYGVELRKAADEERSVVAGSSNELREWQSLGDAASRVLERIRVERDR